MSERLAVAYIKLELPQPTRSNPAEFEHFANVQENFVIAAFKNYCHIEKISERHKISEPNEESAYQVEFKLIKNQNFDQYFLDCINYFLDYTSCIPIHFIGTLTAHSAPLFSPKIVSGIKEVLINNVAFCNILENVSINHWKIDYISYHEGGPLKHEQKIWANFEFDMMSPFHIKFGENVQFEKKSMVTGTKYLEEWFYLYELKVNKKWIKRIVCDPSYEANHRHQRKKRIKLYFELSTPAMVKISKDLYNESYQREFRSTGDKSRSNKRNGPFERVLTISTWFGTSHQLALTDSPWFSMEFEDFCNLSTLHTILSRFRFRNDIQIEFCRFREIDQIYSTTSNPYHYWTPEIEKGVRMAPYDYEDPIFRDFLESLFVEKKMSASEGRNKKADKMRERKFAYVYLIESLLSRGAIVKDQLLLRKETWIHFLDLIKYHFYDDIMENGEEKTYNVCEAALEDLINFVDGRKRIGDLLAVFKRLCDERRKLQTTNQITPDQYEQGFRRVRKLVLTPTRTILVLPETIMSNRVLNSQDHDSTRIMRVAFRDDDNEKMRNGPLGPLLEKTVMYFMRYGVKISNREFGYLGSSNSQMRDNGAYFMEKYSAGDQRDYIREHGCLPSPSFKPKILNFRSSLGQFQNAESIPKAMARLGQCFTQARVCTGLDIYRDDYMISFDIIGGRSPAGDRYKFTDGIGALSMALATQIARDMKLGRNCVPSAYQFRFRGMKGMMAIDPYLDFVQQQVAMLRERDALTIYPKPAPKYERKIEDEELKKKQDDPLNDWKFSCVFRPSQIKFSSKQAKSGKYQIELVKYSSPVGMTLNRPLINILDHVSEYQSLATHRRICERVEELLDEQMASFAKYMVNEDACRARLEDMPRRVHFATLKKNYGFQLSTEPFFRSLIRAAIYVTLNRLKRKTQIAIPTHLGRSMFGVTDETGQLQYGQVYVQYTTNCNLKNPGREAKKTIHLGKVMITKNPSTVPGDVRIFEAVDIPELAHLHDVIVFPQSGPRSHPDEMAGSDLDGDEYSVMWDEALMLERNEPAFHFSTEKHLESFDSDDMDKKMHEFYVKYMKQDSVGSIALNHLYQSDQFGIRSKVCTQLAMKSSQALDFVKSGHPPEPLTERWEYDPETGTRVPPEKAERRPDFAMRPDQATMQPTYQSSRLLGTIFRELQMIDDVMRLYEDETAANGGDIEMDEMLDVEGWQEYEKMAEAQLASYNSQMRSIMENYGVRTEAEIFSGCISEMRNRISDKEQDDMSLYNTEYIIEGKVSHIFRKFREKFFNEFGDAAAEMPYRNVTEVQSKMRTDDETDILRRICRLPTDGMKRKAVAYYKVAYRTAIENNDKRLSFGWIAYDVLNSLRGENLARSQEELTIVEHNPLFKFVQLHRDEYLENNEGERRLMERIEKGAEKPEWQIIGQYCEKYPGLAKLLVIIDDWAQAAHVLANVEKNNNNPKEQLRQVSMARLKTFHIALLFIMFATKQLGYRNEADLRGTDIPYLATPDELKNLEEPVELRNQELNRLSVAFFQYLASRQFRRIPMIDFKPLGIKSIFMRGEWQPMHTAAVKTYYNLLLNLKFVELPTQSREKFAADTTEHCRECVPFVMAVPKGTNVEQIKTLLKQKSRCDDLEMRKTNNFMNIERYMISARGTLQSLQILRNMTSPKVPRNTWSLGENLSEELAKLCLYKVQGKL